MKNKELMTVNHTFEMKMMLTSMIRSMTLTKIKTVRTLAFGWGRTLQNRCLLTVGILEAAFVSQRDVRVYP